MKTKSKKTKKTGKIKKMDLAQFKVEKDKLSKTLANHGKKMLADGFDAFFKAHPDVDAIRWTQYTPHFNDGDVCEFSRHEFDIRGHGDEQLVSGQEMDEDGFYYGWDIDDKCALGKALDVLEDTFSELEDVFQASFGDGVRVVATRKGFTVEDYDHD